MRLGVGVAAGLLATAGLAVLLAQLGGARNVPPLGLPPSVPPDTTKAALGRQLFFDKRMSADARMSCATCHDPAQAFTQNDRATPAGRDGQPLRRNAPSLLNVAFATPLMHDGAAPSLEAQILTPLLDAREMANATFAELEQRLAGIAAYRDGFQAIYAGAPTMGRIGEVLAAYERTLLSGNSPFDKWRYGGDETAMAADAKAGFALFTGKAGCSTCHTVGEQHALFSDNTMHNTGIGAARAARLSSQDAPTVDFAAAGDRGRNEVTGQPHDIFRYRTPSLRNVARTAPYMHDGSLATLDEVVRFYDRGAHPNPNLDPAIKPLDLSDEDMAALIAFLRSLTGDNVDALADIAARESAVNPPAQR